MILPLVDGTEDVKEPQSTVSVATVVFAVIGWIMVITVVVVVIVVGVWYWRHQNAKKYHFKYVFIIQN